MKPECNGCPVLESTVFESLSSEQISRLVCVFRPTRYRKSQVLFFEGGMAQHLFALRSGLVKVVKSLESGKERITRVLFPGEIFGLEALTEATYPVTAIVLQDSEICAVSHDEFFAFLRANADVAMDMIRFVVGEVAQIRTQITDMSFKNARTRVATFLLSLVSPNPTKSTGISVLTLPFSTQEIGEILELSPETVSRTWSLLRREGLIEKRGRQLVIHDLHGLEGFAHR
ncbi:MAG TPA: Crp/Fnr family transcriptional regulator [Terriglobia bacterium]|nr:Crp/Fnr family transcriptional regulator [Terriglobia bacterium]